MSVTFRVNRDKECSNVQLSDQNQECYTMFSSTLNQRRSITDLHVLRSHTQDNALRRIT